MSKEQYLQAVNIFNAEFEKWRDKLIANCNGDYEKVISELCEVMYQTFQTSPEIIKDIAGYLNPSQIEKVISSLCKEKEYHYERSLSYAKKWAFAEWILRKKGAKSNLSIEFLNEYSIHISTDDWNTVTYSYKTLKDMISFWAEYNEVEYGQL